MAGLAPVLAVPLLFVLYWSLTIAGQTFLSFQWDILLLEAGFLALFFAPWRWRMNANNEAPFSRVGFFLLKLLLFKLLFMSRVVQVGRREAAEPRRIVVEFDRARLPLLDAAAPDCDRLVVGSASGMVQEI